MWLLLRYLLPLTSSISSYSVSSSSTSMGLNFSKVLAVVVVEELVVAAAWEGAGASSGSSSLRSMATTLPAILASASLRARTSSRVSVAATRISSSSSI